MDKELIKNLRIERMADLMQLSEDEFERFLPDFIAWWTITKIAHTAGAEVGAMTWIDDGKPGQIHSVKLTIKETGQSEIIKGEAYTE